MCREEEQNKDTQQMEHLSEISAIEQKKRYMKVPQFPLNGGLPTSPCKRNPYPMSCPVDTVQLSSLSFVEWENHMECKKRWDGNEKWV